MKTLFITLCLVGTTLAITYQDILKEEWSVFKQMYNKAYRGDEEDFRFKVFMENKHMIAKHNKLHLSGNKNYSLELNHFADLMSHEFVQIMNGYKGKERLERKVNGSLFLTPFNVNIPDQVDWRQHGRVTPVKDQGACGSCWSFSTTGALESQHSRKAGKLVSLSEQNLIDCSGKFGNNGCNGGLMDYAFQYIKQNHGIDTEKAYPYEGRQGQCRYKKNEKGAEDTGYVDIESGSEQKLKEAVATVGAISIAIDASHPTFQFYHKGVYDEPQCSSTELDHGVLLVGYGTENGKDYWLVKNSWSTKWGDEGYVKMARNKNNQCGVATAASYPLV